MTVQKLLQNDDEETVLIDGNYEDMSEIQRDLDQELDAIFSEFGGDDLIDEYQIRVYRPQPGKGNVGYLFACMPSELPILDKLRDEYGGGDFEVRIIKNGKIFRRRKTIVEPPLKKPEKPHTSTSELMMIVNTMNNGFNKLGEMLIEKNTTQIDPITIQTQMLQNMIAMKDMLGLGGAPAQEKNALAQLKDLVEIQNMLIPKETGGAGTSDVLLGLANNILPHLAKMGEIENQQKRQPKPIAITQHKTQPQQPQRPQKQPNPTGSENPMKMHLIFLTQMAKKNADPYIYAQMVLDNTPPEKLPELVQFIASENCFQEISRIYTAASHYPAWYAELRDYILQIVNDTVNGGVNGENLTNVHISANNSNNTGIPGVIASQTIDSNNVSNKTPETTNDNDNNKSIISDS